MPYFLRGCWGLNSDPHACLAHILLTGLPLYLMETFLKAIVLLEAIRNDYSFMFCSQHVL